MRYFLYDYFLINFEFISYNFLGSYTESLNFALSITLGIDMIIDYLCHKLKKSLVKDNMTV